MYCYKFFCVQSASVVFIAKEERMIDSNDDIDSYSPKTKKVMTHEKARGEIRETRRRARIYENRHTKCPYKEVKGSLMSMHESERSRSGSPNNPSNRSHKSHKSERSRREKRHKEEETKRERRYIEEPRRMRRYEENPRRAPSDVLKCKTQSRRRHIDTWLDLRREIGSRFVLASYARDLYNKLHIMYQGPRA
ncbi:hypothetical protein CR513_29291, partial [Mucuna pruriens]